jgi:hypothetical protein
VPLALLMKASHASRCACSELNSCSSPSSDDLRVRPRNGLFRFVASAWPLAYSSAAPVRVDSEREGRLVRPKNRGPDQCAPVIRAAIMVSERSHWPSYSNPSSSTRTVWAFPAPLTHQPRARLQHDTGIER